MNILLITPVIPGPAKGKRPLSFLTYLSKEHNIDVLCFSSEKNDPQYLTELDKLGVKTTIIKRHKIFSILRCCFSFFNSLPIRVCFCNSFRMKKTLLNMITEKQYDIVHIDRLRMGEYAKIIKHFALSNNKDIPVLIDFTDAIVMFYERYVKNTKNIPKKWIFGREKDLLNKYEESVGKFVNRVIICSTVDSQYVLNNHPDLKIDVVKNVIDVANFKPKRYEDKKSKRMIFTGVLSYYPNKDAFWYFYNEIYHKIRDSYPDIEFLAIGMNPSKRMQSLHNKNGVTIIGPVPNMADYMWQDDIYICPLRIVSGTRFKLIEAMAAGQAIVSTTMGSEGIDIEDGKHILIADSPQEFARAVLKLFENPELQSELGNNAREFVLNNYTIESAGKTLSAVYENIISTTKS